jgi:hypothetical protein
MERVSWSDQAIDDLEQVVEDRSVREQLKRNAEKILQHIPPRADPADEGFEGQIMWHRGIVHEQELQTDAGWLPETQEGSQAWDYFLFYRAREPDQGFEVLAVRSTHQVASKWVQMNREPGRPREPLTDQAARRAATAAPEVELGGMTRGRGHSGNRDQAADRETDWATGRVAVAERQITLKKGTRVTGVDRSKLATLLGKRYDSGESIRSLAASTGRSYGFIHRILTETGVALRGRAGATRYGKIKVRH